MDSFEVSLDDTNKIVRVKATGNIDFPTLEKMIDTARKAAVENGYNIIYDVRQAQTKVAIGNWFFIPRNLEVFKDPRSKKASAVILAFADDKAVEGYKFYATVLGNLGYRVRVLFDETEAVNWLLELENENNFDSANF